MDMFVVGICVLICSLLGLPWYVAATVSALAHIMSLKKESECSAPGEKPVFLGCRYVELIPKNEISAFVFLTIIVNIDIGNFDDFLYLGLYSLCFSEQRVTALVVGILSGLSVFMTKILKVSYF